MFSLSGGDDKALISKQTCMNSKLSLELLLLTETDWLKMWHEARKQEKKIRGLMVDYKKRAERRREFYEKIVRNGNLLR